MALNVELAMEGQDVHRLLRTPTPTIEKTDEPAIKTFKYKHNVLLILHNPTNLAITKAQHVIFHEARRDHMAFVEEPWDHA